MRVGSAICERGGRTQSAPRSCVLGCCTLAQGEGPQRPPGERGSAPAPREEAQALIHNPPARLFCPSVLRGGGCAGWAEGGCGQHPDMCITRPRKQQSGRAGWSVSTVHPRLRSQALPSTEGRQPSCWTLARRGSTG